MNSTIPDIVDTGARHDAALQLIRRYVVASAAVAIIPVPGVDATILAGVHIKLIKALTEHYGESFSENAARNVMLAVAATLVPATIGSLATQRALKLLPPGLGTIAQIGSSGFASYALGRVMMAHFETGGTLDSFDAKNLNKLMWWRQPQPAIAG